MNTNLNLNISLNPIINSIISLNSIPNPEQFFITFSVPTSTSTLTSSNDFVWSYSNNANTVFTFNNLNSAAVTVNNGLNSISSPPSQPGLNILTLAQTQFCKLVTLNSLYILLQIINGTVVINANNVNNYNVTSQVASLGNGPFTFQVSNQCEAFMANTAIFTTVPSIQATNSLNWSCVD